ncbi:ATP-binding cassette sub-family A member 8, transcript variant X1 [Ictidomys tridecemlineatus]|nr:ABC-type organic anion transporter ABCA8 isoform X1 [Ictidomys tridecemlineatus]XP_040124462.1 ABC-type organic anion transporter ABCA8 isoform X1 [Ictidomys tridecemlineatus]KAG3268592.1 ATP-binding cassette sub-family A member 8, transcript variant X2 [Ictidomys tridecemlineatus]KAG3268594.1 ATP-binding cassette sub-family A member 8, transcript variant X1 [Ictidomys tridecemlineatus]
MLPRKLGNMGKRKISVCQQTWALLHKNILKKWRMKREPLMEWMNALLLLLCLYFYPIGHQVKDFSLWPPVNLGRVDSFNESKFAIEYMPVTNVTQQIMSKVAITSFMTGKEVMGLSDEESIKELKADYHEEIVRVIFTNTYSYHLKFLEQRIPISKEHRDHTAHCFEEDEDVDCYMSIFWKEGFVALQAAINAAIIETTTNHSVMEELMSVTGKYMKIQPFISQGGIATDFFIFFCIISFSPFIYYASINVTRERKRMKALMTMMGLQDSAFWLSWGLLYAGFIFIMALFLALIIKSTQFFILTNFLVVFTLFLLYGLSLIALAFLMSVVVKKSFLTSLVVFLLTVFWGSLGFTALYRYLPVSLEWIFSFLSPFAFTLGMSQLLHLDYDVNSNVFLDAPVGSNLIIATHFMLAFDTFLYLALMMYFEKILPKEFGHQHSPWFFLKSSFWSRQQKADHVILEDKIDSNPSSNDSFEPVSPEFQGKEAIRIRNITKEYKGKPEKIEALKDLVLDIYEGQITAILGHSGAGKSTLLNILSGLSVPTKGSVTIYNNKLSEMDALENIIKITGICPQSNVQFDFLTVEENLRLFAKIRGILPQEVEQEIQRVLLELEIQNIQNVLAQNLSGGQKRKLTFGIAILGDPQVFLLDEPSAGMDPFSRHRIWNLLKERRRDRVILFTTQFMDEADLLADRKVFLSKGKLKCAGSSLFLKKKWGIGYHLSLQLNELCAREKITSLVKQHIPDAKLSAESEGKLVYTLPLETTHSFPELYTDLDSNPGLGIENYGVSMTTLNEVFLKLEGKSVLDESGINILGEAQGERTGDTERLVEMEQILSSLMEMRKTVEGMALWGRQICAIAKVRLLKLKHERKALLSLLLILVVGFFPLFLEYILVKVHQNSYTLELSPHLYFLAPGQQPQDPLTRLLIINNTGESIDEFVHALERQSIAVEVDATGTRNGVDEPSYNGAITVFRNEKKYDFLIACNTKRLNCFPVLMDIISNGLLGMLTPSAHIQTEWSTVLRRIWDNPFEILGYTLFWLVLASTCPPYIAMSSIDDYKNSVRSLLRISGLFPSAYWLGQALVDWPLYCLFFLFMYLMDYVLNSQETVFTLVNYFIQMLCAIGYAMSLIFLTYVISFTFRKGKKNSGIWSFCFYVVTVSSVLICVLENSESVPLFFVTFLVPQATLIGCLFLYFHLFMFTVFDDEQHTRELFLVFLIPFLHVIIFLFILRCLEWKFGKKPMGKDPFFRISPKSGDVCQNPEEPQEEDEDVQMERLRTADALNSTDFNEKPVIVASCLRKEYPGKKKHCFSKRKSKVATRNVSFCVRKGEVLGLLGHNGAGKSTSIKVITGDTKSTAGQVLLQGSSGGDAPGFLGYCPQENVLWPNLTVREHLEVFATVKGLSRGDAELAIARLVDAFKLQDQLKAAVKTLSAGIKRKLCFMLSILGSPSVMLLDEPSTGMDPEGQQQMWQAIQAIIRNTERGAILTTHYMAEAEAVCDRVAIMVSGRLRCIGSIQHLKSKFGKDYLLEMKVKTLAQMEALHAEILRLFPRAARQERYSSLMVYKLPVEDVKPLAQAFFKLEKLKQSFHLEEYSLSQSTLEQVFLELSKEQELDVFDDELDPSVNWKLLPQEEP